jgi:hypothetical protein
MKLTHCMRMPDVKELGARQWANAQSKPESMPSSFTKGKGHESKKTSTGERRYGQHLISSTEARRRR